MDNREITFVRDDGTRFIVGDNQSWRFLKGNGLDGFADFTGAVSQVENYSTDGGRIENVRLSLKDRTIGIAYTDIGNNRIARDTFKKFFVYNMPYNVYVTYMGVTRWARGRLYKMKMSDNVEDWLQTAIMTFRFENPYWLSPDNYGKDIAAVTPMLAFPHLCAVDVGITGGVFEFESEVTIYNDGDANTYPIITVKATGAVENPLITINDATTKIIDTLALGDEIVFNFESLPPTIKKNGSNALGLVDRTSNFDDMYFALGENTISFGADNGDNNMSVSVKFYKKYALI